MRRFQTTISQFASSIRSPDTIISHTLDRKSLWTSVVATALCLVGVASAAPPTWDHIVVVIEENHALAQVIGNTDAAFINNTLVAGGASLANMYGITHPSQPNYLQFFFLGPTKALRPTTTLPQPRRSIRPILEQSSLPQDIPSSAFQKTCPQLVIRASTPMEDSMQGDIIRGCNGKVTMRQYQTISTLERINHFRRSQLRTPDLRICPACRLSSLII